MAASANPAIREFVNQLGDTCLLGQVLIRRIADGFSLRHVADQQAAPESLRTLTVTGLRELAQTTSTGAFRPNKAAPSLRTGWIVHAADEPALGEALRHLYPGALADWFAARQAEPPVTHYREFTARQTGLYRITQILPDTLAAQATRACCDARFCLRRRLWTAPGLAPDAPAAKSVIPCLEPCALLLDLARRAMKLDQEPRADLTLAEGDVPVLLHALETALAHPDPEIREGNSQAPGNPRRLALLRERLRALADLQRGGD